AGGEPEERDARGVDAELRRVRADVAEAAADVVEGRREAMLGRQAVRDRHGRDAPACEVERVAGRLAGIAVHPRPAVHDDDSGRRAGDPARTGVVVAQRDTAGGAVDDVLDELVALGNPGDAGHLAREGHAAGLAHGTRCWNLDRLPGNLERSTP